MQVLETFSACCMQASTVKKKAWLENGECCSVGVPFIVGI